MTSSRYDAFDDPYCYPGTGCLRNKLGIQDAESLQAFELEMSTLRAEEPLPLGRLGPTHYRRVHRHLFQDVYHWAGCYRTVGTSKGGNMFCVPELIATQATQVFRRLSAPAFQHGSNREACVGAAAEFLGDLNALHPFREGNGRAQLSLMHLVALRAGHRLAHEKLEREPFLAAMIASFAGRLQPLEQQLLLLTAL